MTLPTSQTGIFIRVFYLIFDGVLPFFVIGFALSKSAEFQYVVGGLIIIFMLTMVQYMFLVNSGHAPKTDRQFLLAILIPLGFVGIDWGVTGGTFFSALVTLSAFSLISRTVGHLLSASFAPFYTRNMPMADAIRYCMRAIPMIGALALFIIYPIIKGVQLLFLSDTAVYSEPITLFSLIFLGAGLIIQAIRFGGMLDPQGFIDYLGTSK